MLNSGIEYFKKNHLSSLCSSWESLKLLNITKYSLKSKKHIHTHTSDKEIDVSTGRNLPHLTQLLCDSRRIPEYEIARKRVDIEVAQKRNYLYYNCNNNT
ncbi:hypothetical protein MTBBW1_2410011 [Desulfamplus magnetovallimortis]|uniref:Uncharacterized protein n=1 Tax=Desulfamplus magnetovallimortis TaxID=1246637 RepID=A0A1W1HED9_9BACT|nr:hypothetical protein MTBBW1_2410011 [Desulfamplus magnetovallimortis]